MITTALAAVMLVTVGIAGLLVGDYPLSIVDVLRALTDNLAGDQLGEFFVREVRLPRVVGGALVGMALATSGGIFQTITGNPLGSPDVIGFTTGAATGALVQIVLFDGGPTDAAVGAIVGGFVTALIVYLLAWRGQLTGVRLALVGIGVAVVLQAVNSLLVVRADLGSAQTAAQWLAGSLNATTWGTVAFVAVALVVFGPVGLAASGALTMMVMGDDLATGLGVGVTRVRLVLVVTGVALVAVATAATGPIAFVALAAPQISRRLSGTTRTGLVPAALVGAVLVVGSDIIAQRIFAPTQIAVGVVSGNLGGIYLIWLLTREWRKQRG